MRQIPPIFRRFIFLGLFFAIAAIVYGVEEVIDERGPCGDRAVAKWFEQSSSVVEDFEYTESATYNAYISQQRIEYPECLQDLQQIVVEYYYFAWKAEEANDNNDPEVAFYYRDQAQISYDKIMIETDRLDAVLGLDGSSPNALQSKNLTPTQVVWYGKTPASPSLSNTQPTKTPNPNRISKTSTPSTQFGNCTRWSNVTLKDLGKKMCVYGDVKYVNHDDTAWQLMFSDEPGTFLILSYDWYYSEVHSGSCVVAEGKIEKLGTSPVLVIKYHDDLYFCTP